jgi:uncharacterized glyoxalase superfamily protein PhnB
MKRNRSIPTPAVIPVLDYDDAAVAAAWLERAFAFRVRQRIGERHRVQLHAADAAVIVTDHGSGIPSGASVLLRVDDANGIVDRAVAAGATIVDPLTDHVYGERQCTLVDPGGHRWTVSETIRDVDPAEWGGEMVDTKPERRRQG